MRGSTITRERPAPTRERPAPQFGVPAAPEREPRAATRRQGLVVLAVLALVLALIVWASVGGKAPTSRSVAVFGGSAVLPSLPDPVVVDVATGIPTLTLQSAYKDVRAASPNDLMTVGTSNGTLLVDTASGAVNWLDSDNLLANRTDGVALPAPGGGDHATAVADGPDAWVVEYGGAKSRVWLVSRSVVAGAVGGRPGSPVVTHAPTTDIGAVTVTNGTANAVAENGSLWIVTGTGANQRVVEVVPGGREGTALRVVDRGAAPVGSTLAGGVGTGATPEGLVGLASLRSVTVFGPNGSATAPVDVGRVRQIVPVDPCAGSAWFAYENSPTSWQLVGARPTTGGAAASTVRLHGLTSTQSLLSPACDGQQIFAMTQGASGQRPHLVQIDLGTGSAHQLPGVGTYPTLSTEAPIFQNEQVSAYGPRVFFDNPSASEAVTWFTDTGRALVFDKAHAASFNPAAPPGGGVATKGSGHPVLPPSNLGVTPPPAAVPVDTKISCNSGGLKEAPLVPQITSAAPGPHTVAVSWSYPTVTSQECYPQTWSVTLTPQNGAPAPSPSKVAVNDAQQYTFTGLLADTTYTLVVTAYIGTQSTSSLPQSVTTALTGPDAPQSVATSSTGSGWSVSWSPCTGSTCQNPAPVQTWIVTGTVCGASIGSGAGFGTTLNVAGSANGTTVPFTTSAPVGAWLSFTVQGVGAKNEVGDSTKDGSCTEGWAPANPDDFTLDTTTITQPGGASASEQLQAVPLDVPAATAFGSTRPQFIFTVTGPGLAPGGWQSDLQTSSTATVGGLEPNQAYVATVTANPTGHPGAAGTVQSAFTPSSIPWPQNLAIGTANASIDVQNPNTATIDATVANAFADGPPGLGLVASVVVGCDNAELPESNLAVTPSGTTGQITIPNFNAVTYGGNCTIQLTGLAETATNVHGGPYVPPSGQPAVPFVLGATSLQPIPAADFDAAWNPEPPLPGSTATPYSGSSAIAGPNVGLPIASDTGLWTVSFAGQLSGGSTCTGPLGGPGQPALWSGGTFPSIDVSNCLAAAAAGLTTDSGTYGGSVNVTYFYLGTSESTEVPLPTFSLQATSVPDLQNITATQPGGCGPPQFCPGQEVTLTGLHLSSVTTLTLTPDQGTPATLSACQGTGPSMSCFTTGFDGSGNVELDFVVPGFAANTASVDVTATNPYGTSNQLLFTYQPGF